MDKERKRTGCCIKDITPRDQKNGEYLDESEYSLALEKFYSGKERFMKISLFNFATDKVYMASNENLEETHNFIGSLENERVLTVGSSFDQVLKCILNGAKDITLMDANILSKYYAEYKMAMIKNLDFKTFSKVFKTDGVRIFSPYIYKRIFHDLSKNASVFWGTIFLDQELPIATMRDFFHGGFELESDFYQSESAYMALREKLDDVDLKFCLAEFKDFPKYASGQYGYIDVSNIFDYVSNGAFKKVIHSLYDNNLKDGGKMQVFYSFGMPFPKKKVLGGMLHNLQRHMMDDGASSYILMKPSKQKEEDNIKEM
ncbi:MAG: DUF3419 family protein [Clostridia bacterium]|nr:DUF3419 family protein [Clostridia bacterium]